MIIEFTKIDGLRISIDTDSIICVEEYNDITMIKTIIEDFEIMDKYEDVLIRLLKIKDTGHIQFSKN